MRQKKKVMDYLPKKRRSRGSSSDLWRMIRDRKCEQADCDIKEVCVVRGLPELCSRWLNPQEYYDIGEDWRASGVAKLVMPHGVTETGWLYTCDNCGVEFEMVREIHIPLCIGCREILLRQSLGDDAFETSPRGSRKIGGPPTPGGVVDDGMVVLETVGPPDCGISWRRFSVSDSDDDDDTDSGCGGVGGVEGEGEREEADEA